jgi:hypothetical protein
MQEIMHIYLEIMLFKIGYIFPPKYRIFVHGRPIQIAEKNFLLVLIKRA